MSKVDELSDAQLLQYSRQIMLPQIDVAGQQKLIDANVLMLGAGGLGCPALYYLVTAGVGNIVIVDHDVIDVSNIQRQILYTLNDVGQHKADVASVKLNQLSTQLNITPIAYKPDEQQLRELITQADVVLDGTDNFQSRYFHNQLCVQTKTPLISGAVIRFEGQITTFDTSKDHSPCYHCLYPNATDEQQLNCTENGVLGSVAGMIGTMMATEAIKIIVGIGESLVGKLILLDALHMEWRTVKLSRDSSCPVCSGN